MRGILTWACDSESGTPLPRSGRPHVVVIGAGLRGPGGGACPARRRRRRHPPRRQQLPHLPTAALPGGHRRARRRERRLRHPRQRPRPPLATLQRDRPDGAGVVGRRRRTRRRPRRRRPGRLRHLRAGERGRLQRLRRVRRRRAHVAAQARRRRHRPADPRPQPLRGGGRRSRRSSPTVCSTSSSAAAARPASRWPAVCTSCTGWCWPRTSRSCRCATPESRSSRWATACWRRSRRAVVGAGAADAGRPRRRRPPRRQRRPASSGSWSTSPTASTIARRHDRVGHRRPGRGPRGHARYADARAAGAWSSSRTCRIPGHPEVFAIGDIAASPDVDGGRRCPRSPSRRSRAASTSPARSVGRLQRSPTEPFHYRDKGQMATIGRHDAVTELANGWRFSGPIGWAGLARAAPRCT